MKQKKSKALKLLEQVRRDLLTLQEAEPYLRMMESRVYPGSLKLKSDLVQESAADDRMSRLEADVDAMDRKIARRLAAIRRRRVYAETLIAQIDKVLYRQLLTLYYTTTLPTYEEHGRRHKPMRGVCLLSLADVAVSLNRSVDRTKHLHLEAIRAFERVYKGDMLGRKSRRRTVPES